MSDRRESACHLCFGDRVLQSWIKDQSTRRGRCPWCQRIGALIPLTELSEPFRAVVDFYEEATDPPFWRQGEQIGFLLNEDWQTFSESIQVANLSQELATSILRADLNGKERYDFPDYDGLFVGPMSSLEESWDSLSAKRLDQNAEEEVDVKPIIEDVQDGLPTQLAIAFEDLSLTAEAGTVLFRARIHDERTRKDRYTKSEVLAPPPDKAKAGRANRKGHPVLYLSTNRSTALAEVRSWKGAAVALARFQLSRSIRLVNLTKSVRISSPFFSEILRWDVNLAALLERLASDMSRPVMPHEEEILYRPTQLLAMAIQSAGYDGFRYPSAMGSGHNVVLFKAEDASVQDIGYVRIKRAAYFSESLSDYDEPYDEGPYDFALQQ